MNYIDSIMTTAKTIKINIILILIYACIPYFSYSSTCIELVHNSNEPAESDIDVLNILSTARKAASRELSIQEEQTISHLYNFIRKQSEPLTPKQIFDKIAFELEQAGFNLYELWNIAHSNTLQMSAAEKRSFKRLLKGQISNDELGLPLNQTYPEELHIGSIFNSSVNHGNVVYGYHHRRSYNNPDRTAVNNSHPLIAMASPLKHQQIFGWADFGLGHGYIISGVKEPLQRFITNNFLIGNEESNAKKRRVFAVYFLYNGQIIKEYLPWFSKDMQLVAFGLNNGLVQGESKAVIPKRRRKKDTGLLRYFLQRLKQSGERSLPNTLFQDSQQGQAFVQFSSADFLNPDLFP